jgi:hypothetical protein
MKILEQGCTCDSCLEATKQCLQEARERWKNGDRHILFEPYHYECGEGCCSDWGTRVFINGFKITSDGDNTESAVEALMEFLEFDGVNIDFHPEY